MMNAQAFDCRGTNTPFWLHSNNIRASFFPRGNKFTDGNIGQFLVPFDLDSRLSTIFASSVWIGGFDDAGNFKLAAEAYPPSSQNQNDFSVGPLSSIGILFDSTCTHYDRAWSVYREDIMAHKMDYLTDFKLDDTIASIFQWPARGNKHFVKYYGFELPMYVQGLAPFRDSNGNNIYDPENGDYPIVFPHSTSYFIPDQILWMVFNDISSLDEAPLRFEIQLTAFAFHCQENTWLNNTIFNSYKIINRAVTSIDSVFFGMWTDYDLGCSADDLIGSDSLRNTEFVYNDDNGDGSVGLDCSGGVETYGYNPPVQTLTYLSHPMHSFIESAGANSPIEIYRRLNGRWNDNSPIYPQDEGYSPGSSLPPTRFLYNGDPRENDSWSANNVLDVGKDFRTLSSVKIGRLDPGQFDQVIMAYSFHHHPDSNYNGQLSLMYNNIDSLLGVYHLGENCTPFPVCEDDCVWPGDFNKDGIADHFDLLHWGLMKDHSGPSRNGLMTWRRQEGMEWGLTSIDGVNFKHGDADGSGYIDEGDLDVNVFNFLMTNESYVRDDQYPVGDELVITSMPLDLSGNIRRLAISANKDIHNVFGLAFELEFDTSYFEVTPGIIQIFSPDSSIYYGSGAYYADQDLLERGLKYSFVRLDHQSEMIQQNFRFEFFLSGLRLKSGVSLEQVPETTVIKLRNLVAIDEHGNDLHIGSNSLVLHNPLTTAVIEPADAVKIYPNPANGFISIDLDHNAEMQILDLHGKLVKQLTLGSNQRIDVSDLSNGIYFLRIPEYGLFQKLIVQH